jgi:hypothetical protein
MNMADTIFTAFKQGRMGSGRKRASLLLGFQYWLSQKGESESAEQQCENVRAIVDSLLLELEAETASPVERRLAMAIAYWFNRDSSCFEPDFRAEQADCVIKFRLFLRERGNEILRVGNIISSQTGGLALQTKQAACDTSNATPFAESFDLPVSLEAELL